MEVMRRSGRVETHNCKMDDQSPSNKNCIFCGKQSRSLMTIRMGRMIGSCCCHPANDGVTLFSKVPGSGRTEITYVPSLKTVTHDHVYRIVLLLFQIGLLLIFSFNAQTNYYFFNHLPEFCRKYV
jgi:hypothetical protein